MDNEMENEMENEMAVITVVTGGEAHTSYGAKGALFIVEQGKEIPVYTSDKAELLEIEDRWEQPRHGWWSRKRFRVPNGTILKLMSVAKYRGTVCGGGFAYFIVDEEQSITTWSGAGYQGRAGTLIGRLRRLSLDEVKERTGVTVPATYKRYYDDTLVTQEKKEINE